jgi:glycosyltransferase involved in cell wall biosynthesis
MNNVESLSVVIPVFNEERALVDVLADVREGLVPTGIDFEIIVVDDGSGDGSPRLLAELAAADPRIRVLQHGRNMGKGQALRTGLAAAGRQWVLLLDADSQVRLAELSPFRDAACSADVIIGYRQYRKAHPFVRRMISNGYRWLVKTLFALRVRDCGCPFKLIRGDLLRTLPLTASGFGFDAELLWKITLAGEKIVELPVQSHERTSGRSKVTAPGCLACAWELFRIRLRA